LSNSDGLELAVIDFKFLERSKDFTDRIELDITRADIIDVATVLQNYPALCDFTRHDFGARRIGDGQHLFLNSRPVG